MGQKNCPCSRSVIVTSVTVSVQALICNVNYSDRGLEALMEFLQGLFQLEIAGCNEITEQGLWSSLHPRLVSVTINDCINVADECVCAVTQLLPALYEFNLQAYHVTGLATISIFFCFLFCENSLIAWRANQSPLIGETLFSSVPPSNSLVSVSDP